MIISKITPKNRRHFPETKTSATGRMGEGLIEAMGGDIHALVLSPIPDGFFHPTSLSPITEAIKVQMKNILPNEAGSWNTSIPRITVRTAPMPVHTG